MVNILQASRASSVSAPLKACQGWKRGSLNHWRLLPFPSLYPLPLTSNTLPQLLHCIMSRPLVRALCREGGAFGASLTSSNGGGLRGGAVSIRKVPLVGLIAPAPRRSISCSSGGAPFPVPAISRLRNKNTTTTPRFPLTNPWNTTTRHCSSHASSSLVKMAADRDILSDEYVSLPASIPLSIFSFEIANNFFPQCQADQLQHLSVRSSA